MIEKKINKKSFSISDQILFSQKLSLLLSSGISLIEALSMMNKIEKKDNRKKVYEFLVESIQKGVSLNRSIKNIDLKFHSLLVILIQIGEFSGHLSESLLHAHKYLEKKDEMKKKLISSVIYPAFIIVATICMTFFLILYIFPKIIPLLQSLDIELPLITRIVRGFYYFSISYGLWVMLAFSILFLISFVLNKKIYSIKYKSHLYILKIPFLGKYIQIYILSSICNISETLLSSGRSLTETILFSKESSKNIVYKKVFNEIYENSIQGVAFSVSLQKYHRIFPPILWSMCSLGEKVGNLGTMFGYCGKIFEQDIDNALKRISSLIEPMLMVLMGLIVGSIALSIILPVYEITNHLTK